MAYDSPELLRLQTSRRLLRRAKVKKEWIKLDSATIADIELLFENATSFILMQIPGEQRRIEAQDLIDDVRKIAKRNLEKLPVPPLKKRNLLGSIGYLNLPAENERLQSRLGPLLTESAQLEKLVKLERAQLDTSKQQLEKLRRDDDAESRAFANRFRSVINRYDLSSNTISGSTNASISINDSIDTGIATGADSDINKALIPLDSSGNMQFSLPPSGSEYAELSRNGSELLRWVQMLEKSLTGMNDLDVSSRLLQSMLSEICPSKSL